MASSFFNTLNFEGEKLQKENARALVQEELIKELFLANPGIKLSPSQVADVFTKKFFLYPPITSIRRAMTNLSSDKHNKVLVKMPDLVPGKYHLPEHTWMLNDIDNPIAPEKIMQGKNVADFSREINNIKQAVLFE